MLYDYLDISYYFPESDVCVCLKREFTVKL